MATKKYSDLIAAAKAYARRDDILDITWDLLLRIAEARIYRKLRIPLFEKNIFPTVSGSAPYVNIPSDLLEVKLMWTNDCPDLTRVDESTRLRMIDRNASERGGVRYFSRHVDRFNFWPNPNDDVINITYYAEGPGLNSDNEFSGLLNIAFDAYLFGIMVEVMSFTHYDERIKIWEARFQNAMGEVQQMADDAEFAGSIKQEEIVSSDIGVY